MDIGLSDYFCLGLGFVNCYLLCIPMGCEEVNSSVVNVKTFGENVGIGTNVVDCTKPVVVFFSCVHIFYLYWIPLRQRKLLLVLLPLSSWSVQTKLLLLTGILIASTVAKLVGYGLVKFQCPICIAEALEEAENSDMTRIDIPFFWSG